MNNHSILYMKAKKVFLTLLFTFAGVNVWADDAKIIVWQKDGTKTEILFNAMPEFVYADGNVTLQNGNTAMSWPLANLEKFTFENIEGATPTDVKDVKTTGIDFLSDHCAVYDINGRLVKKQIKSLSELPKGVYIINDGNVTTKVVRK